MLQGIPCLITARGVSGLLVDSYSETHFESGSAVDGSAFDNQGLGQAFTAIGHPLYRSAFYLKRDGAPTGNAVSKLYAITGTFGTNAKPTGAALATSDNFDVSTIPSDSYALIYFWFSGVNQYAMVDGTNYCITIEYSGGDASNRFLVGYDFVSSTHPGNVSALASGVWAGSSASDLVFYVYST